MRISQDNGLYFFFYLIVSDLIEAASNVIKYLSVVILFDGLQTYGNGIMRSIGQQKFSLLFSFFGFYVIGMPVGIYLLFKSNLGVLGKLMNQS
jgi:MATE family multidrug resistance protein